jgi:hypothetical protein
MTYLEAVNNVLKRLREETVLSVNDSEYSAQIGVMINDSKTLVEDAWNWSALNTTVSIDTVVDQDTYSLTGITPRSQLIDLANLSTSNYLRYMNSQQLRKNKLQTSNDAGSPAYYTFNDVDANGDMVIQVFPKPDSIVTLEANVVKRPADLVDDNDKLTIPAYPVTQLAYAMAIQERGEAGGMSSTQQYTIAQRAMQDAIALDAAKSPEETIWSVT